MRLLKLVASVSLCISLFTFNSCKKESEDPADDFETTAEEIGKDENVSSDIDNATSQIARKSSFNHDNPHDLSFDQFSFGSCATVTNDSVNHIITIDFGSGCKGCDDVKRSGQIIINYTGTGYFDPGSTMTITFNNFYVNKNHVEGTRTVTNNGLNGAGNMIWTMNLQNMRITRHNGKWTEWNSTRTKEMIAGYGDSLWTNDVYLINGSSSRLDSKGKSVTYTMTDIRRDLSCHFITSGTLMIDPNHGPDKFIDFGNGTCDDIAIVTKNGHSKTIHLHFD